MKRTLCILASLAAAAFVAVPDGGGASVPVGQEDFFESEVRPLLVKHCYECHSEEAGKSKGGLRVDTREAIRAGGDLGASVVPGDLEKSLLIQAVRYRDKDLQMPPKKPLPAEAVNVLERWIAAGAPDPRDGSGTAVAAKPKTIDLDKARLHWAFLPVRASQPPAMESAWVRNDVDRFILARLQKEDWQPGAEADARTLVRRIYFDLTGLPPTLEEVAAYANAPAPDRFERLVDRLLGSPQYGERWGRNWLDVARYADTEDALREYERRYPFAYTYRDWVIRAHNEDMPFDRFLQLQFAADHLVGLKSGSPDLAALGFLTVGRKFNGSPELVLDDQIDLIGRGLLGLTLACARCHDHKFDPVPTADYYSLYGVFASSVEPLDLPAIGTEPDHDVKKAADYVQERAAKFREYEDYVQKCLVDANEHFQKTAGGYLRYLAMSSPNHRAVQGEPPENTPEGMLRPGNHRRFAELLTRTKASGEPFFRLWHECEAATSEALPAVVKHLAADTTLHPALSESLRDQPPADLVAVAELYHRVIQQLLQQGDSEAKRVAQLIFGPGSPVHVTRKQIIEDTERNLITRRLLTREQSTKFTGKQRGLHSLEVGAPVQRAMVVQPRAEPVQPVVFIRGNVDTPGTAVSRRFLQVLTPDVPEAAGPFSDDGRLPLARAIANEHNPLTARVIVNRVWALHFGRGLVPTLDNFGTVTPLPSHPELLDHLASYFIQSGWSLKALHRYILTSATWRQSSAIEGRAQAASLDPENVLLWRQTRRRIEFEPMRDALLKVAGSLDLKPGGPSRNLDDSNVRRAVYGFTDRFDNQPDLRAFNVPLAETSSARRAETVIPQQALYFMNHPFLEKSATAVLDRVPASASEDERVTALYRLIFAREPDARERDAARDFLRHPNGQWLDYAQALLMSNEFIFLD